MHRTLCGNPFCHGTILLLLGKTGSSTSWQKGLLKEEIWNLDTQPPMLLWELMAAKPRTCKEIRSRCCLVAEWPSTIDLKSKGLTFGQYRKGHCIVQRQRKNCPAALEKCRFLLISAPNTQSGYLIELFHMQEKHSSCSSHLKGHALHETSGAPGTWDSRFFWAQINHSASGTTTGGVSVLRIMFICIPGSSLIRGTQNNLRVEVTVTEDCFRTGKCDIWTGIFTNGELKWLV